MAEIVRHAFQFGPFELDVLNRRLSRDGSPVALAPEAFGILLLLVKNHGMLLEARQLPRSTSLEDSIATLRQTLGAQPNGRPYVDIVPRRGTIFDAPVREVIEAAGQRRNRRLPAVIAAVVVVAIVAAVLVFLRRHPMRGSSAPAIAVLPFRTPAADAALGFGMADGVVGRLAGAGGVVRANRGTDPLGDARAAGVGRVLDGELQRTGDRVSGSVRLVDASDGSAKWTDRFDEPVTNIFAVQDRIAARVAETLGRHTTSRQIADDIAAYQPYIEGRYLAEKGTAESLLQSINLYQQAVARDPRYAPAYASLADAYDELGNLGALAPGDAYPKAEAAASKALGIDSRAAHAEAARALASCLYDRDWAVAEREFRNAIAHAPADASVHAWYAVGLISRHRFAEATNEIRTALRLDPLSARTNAVAARVSYLTRDYVSANAAAQRAIQLDPSFPSAHAYLAATYAAQGKYAEAEAEQRKSVRDIGMLGLILAKQGRAGAARALLQVPDLDPYGAALIHAALGERDEAIALLERAADEHYAWTVLFNAEPALDPLRNEPRFKALLLALGLPER